MSSHPNGHLLVEPGWLASRLEDPAVVVVDCAWDENAYTRAHIPGARRLPRHAYLKHEEEKGKPGLFVVDAAELVAMAAELGIGPDSTVVAYDEWGSHFATRLWWVMRHYGHDRVRVLDGGWQGWLAHGGAVSAASPASVAEVAALVPAVRVDGLATREQLLDPPADWQLVDARSDGEYDGTGKTPNSRAGHIPGAVHFEWNRALHDSKNAEAVRSFRDPEALQKLLDDAGVTRDRTPVSYCQAAVRGAFSAFTLELMGYPTPRVYDGSMAEWANRDDTPLE